MPDLSKYKAFLFDLDGTLVDSLDLWNWVYRAYIEKLGKIPLGVDEMHEQIGRIYHGSAAGCAKNHGETVMELIHKEYGIKGISPAEGVRIRDELIENRWGEVRYKRGAARFLNWAHDNGYMRALVTMASRSAVDTLTFRNECCQAEADFSKIFGDNIITAENDVKKKPEPDAYLAAAEMLGLSPAECLVFEDSFWGVTAGVRAGMDVVAVYDGAHLPIIGEIRALTKYHINSYDDFVI